MTLSKDDICQTLKDLAKYQLKGGRYMLPIHPCWLASYTLQEIADMAQCPVYDLNTGEVIARPAEKRGEGP